MNVQIANALMTASSRLSLYAATHTNIYISNLYPFDISLHIFSPYGKAMWIIDVIIHGNVPFCRPNLNVLIILPFLFSVL